MIYNSLYIRGPCCSDCPLCTAADRFTLHNNNVLSSTTYVYYILYVCIYFLNFVRTCIIIFFTLCTFFLNFVRMCGGVVYNIFLVSYTYIRFLKIETVEPPLVVPLSSHRSVSSTFGAKYCQLIIFSKISKKK